MEEDFEINKKPDIKNIIVIIVVALIIILYIVFAIYIPYKNKKVNKPNNNSPEIVDKEDENYSERGNEEDFYGDYLTTNVVIATGSPKETNYMFDTEGFQVEISEKIFKAWVWGYGVIRIENPTYKIINDNENHKTTLSVEKVTVLSIKGENAVYIHDQYEEEEVQILKTESKLYLYFSETYFELVTSKLQYKSVNTFYGVKFAEEKYTNNINNIIKEKNDYAKKEIEEDYIPIFLYITEVLEDNDITHITFYTEVCGIGSECSSKIEIINFDKNGKILNINDYLSHIGKDYINTKQKYEELKQNILNDEETQLIFVEIYDDFDEILYYVKDNIMYLSIGKDYYSGDIFIEINL